MKRHVDRIAPFRSSEVEISVGPARTETQREGQQELVPRRRLDVGSIRVHGALQRLQQATNVGPFVGSRRRKDAGRRRRRDPVTLMTEVTLDGNPVAAEKTLGGRSIRVAFDTLKGLNVLVESLR